MASFTDNLINFSHDIYREIDGSQNACVSPFSVISALLMLMAGTGGKSKSQIKLAILGDQLTDILIYRQYKSLSAGIFGAKDNELYIATKLFVSKGLILERNVGYVARTYFKAGIGTLNFANCKRAARIMNRYIARRTNNKIKDLIKQKWIKRNTVMVLVNTFYFKGTWEKQFNPKETRKEDFHLTEQNQVKVDMMQMTHKVRYYNGGSFSAIALPYKGNKYEIIFVLPKRIDGFSELKKSFSPATAKVIDSGFKKTFVSIKIPKFSFAFEANLKLLLPSLGISDIFIDGVADFNNLIQNLKRPMYVSEARHKVVVEVNERGTEAAAATVIVVVFESSPIPQAQFIANHPFMFYIRHEQSGSILFIGHYLGP